MSVSCTEKNHSLFEYEWSTGRTYKPAWILYCRGDGMAVTFIPNIKCCFIFPITYTQKTS